MRTPSRVTEDEWRQWIWKTPFQVGVNKATRNDFLLLGMFKKRETTTVGILACWQVGQLFLERDERACNGTTKRTRCWVGENTGKVPNPCKLVRWNCIASIVAVPFAMGFCLPSASFKVSPIHEFYPISITSSLFACYAGQWATCGRRTANLFAIKSRFRGDIRYIENIDN